MEQVGGAVVGADGAAALDIDRLVERITELDRTDVDLGAQGVEFAEWFRRVLNDSGEAIGRGQLSGVADLSAALAIEGRLIEDEGDGVAFCRAVDPRAVADQREDDALAVMARVTGEFGRAMFFDEVEPEVVGGAFARAFPGGAGSGFLFCHRLVEARTVDSHASAS